MRAQHLNVAVQCCMTCFRMLLLAATEHRVAALDCAVIYIIMLMVIFRIMGPATFTIIATTRMMTKKNKAIHPVLMMVSVMALVTKMLVMLWYRGGDCHVGDVDDVSITLVALYDDNCLHSAECQQNSS